MTALVVDEDMHVCKMFAAILQRLGFAVEATTGGGEALKIIACAKRPMDLVIAEHSPQRLDGLEILRRIRKRMPRARAILTSAHGADRELVRHARGVAEAILVKPFRVKALARFLERLFPLD